VKSHRTRTRLRRVFKQQTLRTGTPSDLDIK
jgi:hypothetical protein